MAQYRSQGTIDRVVPGSPADRAGIVQGDRLLSIDGKPVKDIVGYQFNQVSTRISVEVAREGQEAPLTFTIRKPEQQDLGLEFVDPTFDGIKRCNNHCPFCFVDQNAPGLRRSLDIKDDDFRYSFLYGGFITLTNLKESDWERINEERLSPLYVSVHATELDLRSQLLGNPRIPDVLTQLKRLGDMGIRIHTQLVICPGVNDAEHLDRSISDLAALYPHVQSIGVVPVGLTRFRRNNHYQIKLDLRPFMPEEAAPVVDQVERWQRHFKEEHDTNMVFLSDEWYLMAGRDVPRAREYEEFSQIENGVGLVRQLLDESRRTARTLPAALDRPLRAVVVSGEMPAGTLRRALKPLRDVNNLDVRHLVVKNNTLGGNVACSGLLFGAETAEALRPYGASGEHPADIIFLPRRMFDFTGVRTLDEWTTDKFREELGVPVVQAEWTRDIWSAIQKHLQGEDTHTATPELIRLTALG
jgi:putative radical SAM enzyme (TIGR03279 family)